MTTTPKEGSRDNDRTDTAFLALDSGTAKVMAETYAFLPIDYAEVNDPGTPLTSYSVFGCPWRKVELDQRTFHSTLYEFKLTSVAHGIYDSSRIAKSSHIALGFDKKKMMDGTGRRVTAPNPEGMSGSPLWKLIQVDDSGRKRWTRRLSGIVIEHRSDKRLLVGVRVCAALAGIRMRFPELSPFIPFNSSVELICRYHGNGRTISSE